MNKEPKSVKTDARSWLYSVCLHGVVLLILLLGVGFGVRSITRTPGTGKESQPVKATVVSQDLINKQLAQIEAAEAKKKAAQAAAERRRQQAIEEARQARKAEEQRLAELKRQRAAAAAAAKKQQAEAAREAQERKAKAAQEAREEQQRLAALKAKREAAAKHLAEIKAQAKAEAEARAKAKAKAEAAAKAKAEAERRKREAAARAKAQLQKELAAEKKRRAEQAAAAKQAAERSRALGLYTAAIEQQVERNWIRPASANPDLNCVVDVIQVPGGDVVNATIKSCNGDAAVKQSIISAVYKASPLPEPDDPSLFQREIEFTFAPEKNSE